ncbi:MAG: hypothetical protein V1823_02035 [Chloroflexota bacterium]
MRRKVFGGIGTIVLSFAIYILQKVAEVKEMITKANADLFLMLSIGLFIIGISFVIWAYWAAINNVVFQRKTKTPPLKIIIHNANVGNRLYDDGNEIIQFLIRLTLVSSSETQLDKLYLVYEGQSYAPLNMPTTLVKGTESYEVEYRVPGDAGGYLILQGVLTQSGKELQQAYFSVVGGGLDCITEPFPIPAPDNWLVSHKKGLKIL